jgi:photosystem II stability/assembly factor-like uncharacterized protein
MRRLIHKWVLRLFIASMLVIVGLMAALTISAQQYDTSLYSGLHWRMIGPFRAGRENAVSGVVGQPDTFYFGSVGGGVWKTVNAGRTWNPVFDSASSASIGAIGVAPSNGSVVYVGTGEADMRDSIQFGDGMYKSSDAGKTWKHIGLEATKQIGRVLVDPKNPNIVFVAALGNAYASSSDRGVYRSRDGGATWQKVLFKNDDVGAIDLNFDPTNSQIVYATMWNVRRPPWFIYTPANGPGGGIFKSTDGGTTWNEIDEGIPADGRGRIGISVSPSNRNRIYAVVDAFVNDKEHPEDQQKVKKSGGVFRSDDAGATWTRLSSDERLWGRGWYFEKVTADPKNPDTVYVMNTSVYRSTDAGKTWTAIKGDPTGDDFHQLWIYPDDPKRMVLGSDQGSIVSVDGAVTWSSWYNQATAQIYHVAPDYRFPYWVTGAQQDSGAVGSPSRSRHSEISLRDWEGLCAGGESGYTAPDPLHPEILFGGTVSRCNVVTGETKTVSPETRAPGQGRNAPSEFRHAWTQPLVFSQADPHALYYANQFLYKTTNGGESWTQLGQDLTREDPGVPPNLNAEAAADAPTDKRRGVIYTIAPSPLKASLLWIGTDDGLIKMTTDDGRTFQDVTPPALTSWSKVTMIDASHFDVKEAFASVERHQLNDYDPHIFRTRDAGKTWTEITNGLPKGIYVQTVKEDPQRRGMLFAGTERAVFVSFDDGDHWQTLQLNLPPASMRDLAFHGDDMIVATHGRGFWVLDNIAMLRQLSPSMSRADAILFQPADAMEIISGSDNGTPMPRDEPLADNSPTGAMIDFYLKTTERGPVTLEIIDPAGDVIRKYSSEDKFPPVDPDKINYPPYWARTSEPLPATAGMHRWIWDFRATSPQRPAGGGGGGGGFGRGGGQLALPGTYAVRLTVNGKSETKPLAVKPDPRSK